METVVSHCVVLGLNQGPLQKQHVLLAAELPLQAPELSLIATVLCLNLLFSARCHCQVRRLGQGAQEMGALFSFFAEILNESCLPGFRLLPHSFQRAAPAHRRRSCTCWPGVPRRRGCAHTGRLLMVCPLRACTPTRRLH